MRQFLRAVVGAVFLLATSIAYAAPPPFAMNDPPKSSTSRRLMASVAGGSNDRVKESGIVRRM